MMELPVGFRWEDAPEGTTHFLKSVKFGQTYWLKKEGEMHQWKGCAPGEVGLKWPILGGFWPDEYENPASYLLIERPLQAPQVVVIIGAEVDWGKAPEGTTHAATDRTAIRMFGQWRKLEGNAVFDWKGGEWVERVGVRPANWKQANRGDFIEKPGLVAAAPVAKKQEAKPVKVEPKRQVGWWN